MPFTFQAPVPLFRVFDLQSSIDFYVHALCFELVAETEVEPDEERARTWALLRAGDLTLMLRTAYPEGLRPALPDPSRVLHHGDTVLYLSCDDLEALRLHLRQKGVTTKRGTDTFAGMEQVFVNDLDGYVLCFQRLSTAPAWRCAGSQDSSIP